MSEPFDAEGFNEDVGRRIQFQRKQRRLTQQEVADIVGIPRATYANHESGRQRIAADVLWRVALTLECPIVRLLPEPVRGRA